MPFLVLLLTVRTLATSALARPLDATQAHGDRSA